MDIVKKYQKPDGKVEPKFKVGDWIIFNGLILHIDEMINGYYRTTSIVGIPNSYDWGIDNAARLWTIQDAKDGDVLVNGSNIFIFNFIYGTRLMGYCHVNTDDERFYNDLGKNECFCLIDAIVTPATKEQRDLLFQKMKEAGYEWDSEKNKLKKIENEPIGWTEDDKWMIKNICHTFEKGSSQYMAQIPQRQNIATTQVDCRG